MPSLDSLKTLRWFPLYLSGLIAIAPFAIDVYLPALPQMAAHFGTDLTAVNLTVSAYLIGNAIGQFFGGSLSDQVGRKPVALAGLAVFVVASIGILLVDSIAAVQALRVAQGLGGGLAGVLVMAQVKDVYPSSEVSRRFANVIVVVYVAPLIAPLIGALLAEWGWQWVFVFLTLYAGLALLITLLCLPETLRDKPEKFRVAGLFEGYRYAIVHRTQGDLAGFKLGLFIALTGGILMSFLVNASSMYMGYFGLGPWPFAFAFAGNAVVLMAGNRMVAPRLQAGAEFGILSRGNAVQLVLIGFLLLRLALGFDSFWLVFPLWLSILFIHGGIISAASGLFIRHYPRYSGSASSLCSTMRLALGGIIGGVAALFSGDQIFPLFALMLVVALLARLVLLSVRVRELQDIELV